MTRIGDWLLFEKHTIIRFYGFEEEPFLFPTFLTPRIYALEYIRKSFFLSHGNFSMYHKPITFKFPYAIGHFLAKRRIVRNIANELLSNMKFKGT